MKHAKRFKLAAKSHSGSIGNKPAQRYLARKKFARNKFLRRIYKCVYLSLFMITKLFLKSESLFVFKIILLLVPIGKKPATGDHESSLNILLAKLSLARCPCAK